MEWPKFCDRVEWRKEQREVYFSSVKRAMGELTSAQLRMGSANGSFKKQSARIPFSKLKLCSHWHNWEHSRAWRSFLSLWTINSPRATQWRQLRGLLERLAFLQVTRNAESSLSLMLEVQKSVTLLNALLATLNTWKRASCTCMTTYLMLWPLELWFPAHVISLFNCPGQLLAPGLLDDNLCTLKEIFSGKRS